MQFAIKTAPQHTTWQDMLSVWQAADAVDLFESAWTFDHFEPIFSDRAGPCLEGWIALTALAQATTRIRVGVLVTAVPYRHPAVLAKMAATLDVISGGRLELGLGAGWNAQEAEAYGIDLPPIKERMDRFDEACDVIVGLLTQRSTTYDGAHYRLKDAYCEHNPVQQPHPPICFIELQAVLAGHCRELGTDPTAIMTSAHLPFDPANPTALADEAEAFAEAGLDLGIVVLPTPHVPSAVETVADVVGPLAGRSASPRRLSGPSAIREPHAR